MSIRQQIVQENSYPEHDNPAVGPAQRVRQRVAGGHERIALFGAPGGVAGGLRAAGMGLLNALPPARRACVETAAGVGPLSWASTGSF